MGYIEEVEKLVDAEMSVAQTDDLGLHELVEILRIRLDERINSGEFSKK